MRSIFSGNGVGDACQDDQDGDGAIDEYDACPANNAIKATDFSTYQTVALDPIGHEQKDPQWVILNEVCH